MPFLEADCKGHQKPVHSQILCILPQGQKMWNGEVRHGGRGVNWGEGKRMGDSIPFNEFEAFSRAIIPLLSIFGPGEKSSRRSGGPGIIGHAMKWRKA
ncbi:hypothetical protein L210DRAFT_3576678 [Boletus edulis BED1]|uniref:Uncharacterized protein n=1 Tax=Boletus edulis BED1 TaxID=1328754 RepID=A0AAD4BC55_BOLED|nr:hypothetical protein L210DRAFT_3576678 [Boletus edulis BED1]